MHLTILFFFALSATSIPAYENDRAYVISFSSGFSEESKDRQFDFTVGGS
jgi:hypothetical protein